MGNKHRQELPKPRPAVAAMESVGAAAVELAAKAEDSTIAATEAEDSTMAAAAAAEDSTMAAAEAEDSTMAAATAGGASVVSIRGQRAVKRAAGTQLVVQQQKWVAELLWLVVVRRQQRALAWAWASWFSWYSDKALARAVARAKAVQGQQIWQVRQQNGSLDD